MVRVRRRSQRSERLNATSYQTSTTACPRGRGMIFQFPVHNAILSRKTICRIRIFYLWEDQAMLRLKGIHHLAMATRNMEGTIRFWRDLLGLRLVGGLGKKGYKLYFFEICPQNYIIFFEWPHVEPVCGKGPRLPRLRTHGL